MLESVHIFAPCSETGLNHLKLRYPKVDSNIIVSRLGVVKDGVVKMSSDNTLRIVSCSFLNKAKRVYLIAKSLKLLNIPIEWTHIGDGPMMNELLKEVRELPINIKVNFPGMLKPLEIIDYYKRLNEIDLFINVSSSEGVPVSIMECLSLSIPVIATNAGGTSEIVDESVGKLIPCDFEPSELASYIRDYYYLSNEQKLELRKNAVRRYEDRCNAEVLTGELAEMLIH